MSWEAVYLAYFRADPLKNKQFFRPELPNIINFNLPCRDLAKLKGSERVELRERQRERGNNGKKKEWER